ncbi:MAG: hypothetical protein ACI4HI_15210 [Lachnospiraceae bacterium]
MDKEVLKQYNGMKKEIEDIRRRRRRIKKEIERLENETVVVTVKGTQKNGIYGPIKVTGRPKAMQKEKKKLLKQYDELLEQKEMELLKLTIGAEEYIQSLRKTEMRSILRLSIIDGMTNAKVAENMNRLFPNRNIAYTDENIKKKIQRFFENVPQCPSKK